MKAHPECLVVRADASPRIGGGHVMRCLALAQAWNALNGRTIFAMAESTPAIRSRLTDAGIGFTALTETPGSLYEAAETSRLVNEESARWIVCDGYHFTPEYHAALRQSNARLLCVDDEARLPRFEADAVLNQNVFASEDLYRESAPDSRHLLGPTYALLRRQFSETAQPRREAPTVARKILVTLGAADFDNVTLKVIHALRQLDADTFEAVVVVGGSNPNAKSLEHAIKQHDAPIRLVHDAQNMPELMAWADLAISAAGSTTLELAYIGVPMLLLVLAENQAPVAERMHSLGAARNLGLSSVCSLAEISRSISSLISAEDERAALITTAQRLVDGQGAKRVALFLKAPIVHLRPVVADDARLLFTWANDPGIRAASFSSRPIEWEEHKQWLTRKLANANVVMFVGEKADHKPAGVVRFDIEEHAATVSVAVAPDLRGQGYGQQLIEEASRRVLQRPDVQEIRALVKPDNIPSQRAFLAAGFHEDLSARTAISQTYLLHRSIP